MPREIVGGMEEAKRSTQCLNPYGPCSAYAKSKCVFRLCVKHCQQRQDGLDCPAHRVFKLPGAGAGPQAVPVDSWAGQTNNGVSIASMQRPAIANVNIPWKAPPAGFTGVGKSTQQQAIPTKVSRSGPQKSEGSKLDSILTGNQAIWYDVGENGAGPPQKYPSMVSHQTDHKLISRIASLEASDVPFPQYVPIEASGRFKSALTECHELATRSCADWLDKNGGGATGEGLSLQQFLETLSRKIAEKAVNCLEHKQSVPYDLALYCARSAIEYACRLHKISISVKEALSLQRIADNAHLTLRLKFERERADRMADLCLDKYCMNGSLLSFVFRGDPLNSADVPFKCSLPLPICTRSFDRDSEDTQNRFEYSNGNNLAGDGSSLGRKVATDLTCLKSALHKYEALLSSVLQEKIGKRVAGFSPLAAEVMALEGEFSHGRGELPGTRDGVEELDAIELQELEHIVQFLNSLAGS